MKRLLCILFILLLTATPTAAQFGACLPGFCRTPSCVNSGHASAFLARTSGLDGTHVTAYTNFLNSMDSDGLTCLFDFLYIYATQDSTTALLNLVKNSFNGVIHGVPTFTADSGFSGTDASTTVYIDTGFNPTIEAATSQFQQNTAHLSVWNLTNATSIYAPVGAADAINNTLIYPEYTDTNAYFRVNINGIGDPIAVGTPLGHFFADHDHINNPSVHNGTNIATIVDTSQTVLNLNLYTIGTNNNGTPLGSASLTAAVSGGNYLTPTQYANFYTHLRTYMTAVGVP